MSKQAQAKQAQNYNASPILPTCGNCVNFRSERQLADWMVEANKRRAVVFYTLEDNGVEKNLRCGIGGFAVKKMGSCSMFSLTGEDA